MQRLKRPTPIGSYACMLLASICLGLALAMAIPEPHYYEAAATYAVGAAFCFLMALMAMPMGRD